VREADVGGVFPHHDPAAWGGIGQRPKQYTFYRAENGGVSTDTQGERRQRDREESGIARHLAKRRADIVVRVHAV
jgi:hypothetical protein